MEDAWREKMNAECRWTIGVSGAVVANGRVLLVRHTYGDKRGRWSLPGGYAAPDERLDQAVRREVREETGLESEVIDLIGLANRCSQAGGLIGVVYRLRPLSGRAAPDGAEVDRIGWFSPAQIAALDARELEPASRNTAIVALQSNVGLLEDGRFPLRSQEFRGFLLAWEA
jgi:ADP-ribose pyrophosphatase YjhB (NUDIX family)